MIRASIKVAHPVHVISGLVMCSLGTVGLIQFWGEFGAVGRGIVPFGLVAGGLIIAGAGFRVLREGRGLPPSFEALTPIVATVACLVLGAAAASNIDVSLPHAWEPQRVVGYMALGLVSGIVGGMLGLGGGVVHLSGMMLLFGLPFSFARGATLINNVFINAAAALRYGRRRLIVWHVAAVLLPMSLVGVAAGTFLQVGFDEELMRRIFAVFILIVTVGIALETYRSGRATGGRGDGSGSSSDAWWHGGTGGLAGFLSGLLGISGGVVAVPGQTLVGGVPLRNAIANSTFVTSISSALGVGLLFLGRGSTSFSAAEMATIALLFIPGNLIGGHFGALWMEKLPVVVVRYFFVTALIAIAIRSWGWVS